MQPPLVVGLGEVLTPVRPSGLESGTGLMRQDRGNRGDVRGLPRLCGRLRRVLLRHGRDLVGRCRDGGSGTQHAHAIGHRLLDQRAGSVVDDRRGAGSRHRVTPRGQTVDQHTGDAIGEHEPFEQGVGRQPVGAVNAGAGHFAAGEQSAQRCAAGQVGADAATGVVLRGRDGDELRHRIDPQLTRSSQDRGEPFLPDLGTQAAAVEPDVGGACLAHRPHDGLGHNVARSEFRQWVQVGHEPPPVRIQQDRPFTAHGLRHQRLLATSRWAQPHDRRMELDELQVGHHCAGSGGHGHPVPSGDLRVRGGREHLPQTARGQHDGRRQDSSDAVTLPLAHDVQREALHRAGAVEQQIQSQGLFVQDDVGVVLDCLHQGTHDLGAGGVAAGMGDPVAQVTTLAGQRDVPPGCAVEPGAERNQVADRSRALGHKHPHGVLVAQAGAGDQGVAQMVVRGVVLIEGCSDTALRPLCGAMFHPGLGHNHHAVSERARIQRQTQAGDTGTDDDHIAFLVPAGCGRQQWGSDDTAGDGRGRSDSHGAPKTRGTLSMSRGGPTLAAMSSLAGPACGAGPKSGSVTAT